MSGPPAEAMRDWTRVPTGLQSAGGVHVHWASHRIAEGSLDAAIPVLKAVAHDFGAVNVVVAGPKLRSFLVDRHELATCVDC